MNTPQEMIEVCEAFRDGKEIQGEYGFGIWIDCGWNGAPDDSTAMGIACETIGDGERRYWIEAELDAPEVATVQGKVTPA